MEKIVLVSLRRAIEASTLWVDVPSMKSGIVTLVTEEVCTDQAEFLHKIHNRFLDLVDPFSSGLMDELRAEKILDFENCESILRYFCNRRAQAQALWISLHHVPLGFFENRVYPALQRHYPEVLSGLSLRLDAEEALPHESWHYVAEVPKILESKRTTEKLRIHDGNFLTTPTTSTKQDMHDVHGGSFGLSTPAGKNAHAQNFNKEDLSPDGQNHCKRFDSNRQTHDPEFATTVSDKTMTEVETTENSGDFLKNMRSYLLIMKELDTCHMSSETDQRRQRPISKFDCKRIINGTENKPATISNTNLQLQPQHQPFVMLEKSDRYYSDSNKNDTKGKALVVIASGSLSTSQEDFHTARVDLHVGDRRLLDRNFRKAHGIDNDVISITVLPLSTDTKPIVFARLHLDGEQQKNWEHCRSPDGDVAFPEIQRLNVSRQLREISATGSCHPVPAHWFLETPEDCLPSHSLQASIEIQQVPSGTTTLTWASDVTDTGESDNRKSVIFSVKLQDTKVLDGSFKTTVDETSPDRLEHREQMPTEEKYQTELMEKCITADVTKTSSSDE